MTYRANGSNGTGPPDWLKNRQPRVVVDAQRKARRQATARAGIASKLKEAYAQVVSEPLPASLSFLLDRIDQESPDLGDA